MQNDIHVWPIDLHLAPTQIMQQRKLLSSDELERVQRLHDANHQRRFIVARSFLRIILSSYLDTPPEEIVFAYTEHNKVFLADTTSAIQFNLSHSADKAVIAINKHFPIGIDIEKIQAKSFLAIAKRFFSPEEYAELSQLPDNEASSAFFCLWSRKEAVVKAVGKGLSIPLSSFSLALDDRLEEVTLEDETWSLVGLPILPGYQIALACRQPIQQVSLWHFFDQKPKLDKVFKW
jgi:4'-phosphopantetheinyl transferase